MKEIENHITLRSLPRDLRTLVAGWIDDFSVDIGTTSEGVYEDLRLLIFEGSETIDALPQSHWEMLKTWILVTPREGILGMINRRLTPRDTLTKVLRKATTEQIRIIQETQREVSLDFSRFLGDLTSWEADAIIKGVVLISEIQRHTGDRHFPLREVRKAIRNHILSGDFSKD